MISAGFGFGEAVVSSSSSAFVADSSEFQTLGAGMGMQGTIGDSGHASGCLFTNLSRLKLLRCLLLRNLLASNGFSNRRLLTLPVSDWREQNWFLSFSHRDERAAA